MASPEHWKTEKFVLDTPLITEILDGSSVQPQLSEPNDLTEVELTVDGVPHGVLQWPHRLWL